MKDHYTKYDTGKTKRKNTTKIAQKIMRFFFRIFGLSVLIYIFFIILLMIGFLFFFGSYADGTYEKCMEKCVLPDKSNEAECSLSTCDFPI